jgi:hypothetical protein
MNSSRSWHGSSRKPETKSDTQTSARSGISEQRVERIRRLMNELNREVGEMLRESERPTRER